MMVHKQANEREKRDEGDTYVSAPTCNRESGVELLCLASRRPESDSGDKTTGKVHLPLTEMYPDQFVQQCFVEAAGFPSHEGLVTAKL